MTAERTASWRPANDLVQLNDLIVDAGAAAFLREAGLDSLDALFQARDAESLDKPGLSKWRERLRLRVEDASGSRVLYLKRFKNPPNSVKRDIRRADNGAGSVAGVEWTWLRILAAAGIACPRAIAYGDEFLRGREVRSVVLMAAVPGRSLYVLTQNEHFSSRIDFGDLLHDVAELVAKLHGHGYVHRDLYLSHLYYDGPSSEKRLHLIDLQRVLKPAWRAQRWIVKDLASLNYSTPDHVLGATRRIRWLVDYLSQVRKLRHDATAPQHDGDGASAHEIAHVAHRLVQTVGVRRKRRLDPHIRRLIFQIVGKTNQIARHDRRRNLVLKAASA